MFKNQVRSLTLLGMMLAGILVPLSASAQTNWVQESPAASPGARYLHGLVYDEARHQVLLYGGTAYGGVAEGDTWIWDGSAWTQKTFAANAPTPGPRAQFALAYDAARQQVVLFGGYYNGYQLNDTWLWDGSSWTQAAPAHVPSVRQGSAMAYDAAHQQTVLFGGFGTTIFNDTWTWDGSDWKQQNPAMPLPPVRYRHGMAYDVARQQVVLFGGTASNGLSDTWVWDGSAWTQKLPGTPLPPARYIFGMTYDSIAQKTVIFGGNSGSSALNDTWEWDGTNWTAQSISVPPHGRYGQAMAYDEEHRQTVLFGGLDSIPADNLAQPFFSDTWVFGAPLSISITHTGNYYQGQTNAVSLIQVSTGLPTSGTVSVDINPAGAFTVSAINAPNWTCSVGTRTCSRSDVLNGGSYETIQLIGTIDPAAPSSISNMVTLSAIATSIGVRDTANVEIPSEVVQWGATNTNQAVGEPTGTGFVAIAAGGSDYSLGLKADGSIVQWGNTASNQAVGLPTGGGFVAISAGYFHSLALKSDGSIVQWGDTGLKQAVGLPTGSGFLAIAAGGFHCVALKSDGSLVQWGDTSYNQAAGLPTGSGFVAIAAGYYHSVALKSDGTIVQWGNTGSNQALGLPATSGFVAIAAGFFHNLALKSDGTIVQWGDTGLYQAVGLPTGSGFAAIAAGGSQSLALKSDGTIVQWGDNSDHEEDGLPIGNGFVAISAGQDHSLALLPVANATVTITSSPVGLSFSVSGTGCSAGTGLTTPMQLSWTPGSSCIVTFTTPQGTPPNQYTFRVWADGPSSNPRTFSAPAAAATYTANFLKSQSITFNTIPQQTVGTPLGLTATASSGLQVSYSSTTMSVCTVNGSSATFLAPGSCSITASQTGDGTTYAPAQSVTQSFNVVAAGVPLITSQSPGPVRNNYGGFVGFEMTIGGTPVTVYSLGRFIVAGNTQSHLLKLVMANGTDVAGGSAAVSTSGAAAGTYQYAALSSAVTLAANTSYFLVSQETVGGDNWYDFGSVSAASVAKVAGPAYVDQMNHYVAATVLPGQSYVPLNFLYAPPTTALSVSITSPVNAATVSGTTSITVSTTGPVTGLRVQVDGVNHGGVVPVSVNQGPSYTLSLDTTVLKNGGHALTVVASDAASDMVSSAAVSITVSNSPGGSTPFVTGQTPGPVRNNYSGFVGMAIRTGSTPVVVSSLGRFAVAGNSGTHLVKMVQANGMDVPGGSVSISMASATAGTYQYAALPAGPFSMAANTTYYLVSQESSGGDQWYDYGPVSTSVVASVAGPVYTDSGGNYVTGANLSGDSYVPVSFLYGPGGNTLSATITSPTNGALISGSVPVTVNATGSYTSLQLQVDGANTGAAVAASPITLDTTALSKGQHTLTVIAIEGGASAVSPGVTVTVNNSGGTSTVFVISETPRPLRNNYTGFVGMAIDVGAAPVSVTQLGRMVATGNSGTHVVKLVNANGTDVANGAVTVNVAGGTVGTFAYAALPSTVVLAANTRYFLVSHETAGGDMWFDLEQVQVTAVAAVAGPTYTDGHGSYVVPGGFTGYSYVPVSFQYQ